MPRKARALDLRAAIAMPEKAAEVTNITFAELCTAYIAVVFDGADLRVRKWVEAFGSTSASTARAWTPRNVSPPGNVAALAWPCTTRHAGSLTSFLSSVGSLLGIIA